MSTAKIVKTLLLIFVWVFVLLPLTVAGVLSVLAFVVAIVLSAVVMVFIWRTRAAVE